MIDRDGAVWCWGALHAIPEVGDGGISTSPHRMKVDRAEALAAEMFQTCALTAEGVWCWGGKLPDPRLGGQRDVFGIERVGGTEGATGLRASVWTMCARWSDGRETCWSTTYGPLEGADGGAPNDRRGPS